MGLEAKSIFNSQYVSNTDHLKFVSIFSKTSRVSQELMCYKFKADQSEEDQKSLLVCFFTQLPRHVAIIIIWYVWVLKTTKSELYLKLPFKKIL